MEASQTLGARARAAAGSAGVAAWIVLALGVTGGVLLVVAEFSLIFQVDTLTSGTCEELRNAAVADKCRAKGLEQHSFALILLGVFAIAMALGAARGASVPAAVALVVVGLVVVGIALFIDLPKTKADGLLEPFYEQGRARAATGFYLELVGAGLCLAAGAIRIFALRRT